MTDGEVVPIVKPFWDTKSLWIGGSDLRSGAAEAVPAIPELESALPVMMSPDRNSVKAPEPPPTGALLHRDRKLIQCRMMPKPRWPLHQ